MEQPGSRGHTLDKQKSKVSTIKKILNKNIKLNHHIKFDDQGEVMEGEGSADQTNAGDSDSNDSITPVPISEFESQGKMGLKVGGIQIEEAQKMLKVRDRIDRDFERERIRQAHRGRRLKGKKQSLSEDSGGGDMSLAVVTCGVDEEEEEGSVELGDGRVGRKRKREEEKIEGRKKWKRGRGVDSQNADMVESEAIIKERGRGGRGKKSGGNGIDHGDGLLEDEELAKHLLGF